MSRYFDPACQRQIALARWAGVHPLKRKQIALHLRAIMAGKRAQVLYRERGITDPCKKAREVHMANARKRREAKALGDQPRSRVLPIA